MPVIPPRLASRSSRPRRPGAAGGRRGGGRSCIIMDLTGWIDPRHLTESAIAAMARRFAGDPHHAVIIDDFLAQPRIAALRRLFSTEGEFAEQLPAGRCRQ